MSHFGLGLISSNGVPGNDAFTKILLHMDGSNGGTTFTDVNAGGSSHTWTPTNATTSTSAAKFGPSSMLGSAGYITTPAHSDFNIGTQDFAVDFWLNNNGVGATGYGLCGQINSGGTAISTSFTMARFGGAGLIGANIINSGAGAQITLVSLTGFASTSTWDHIALTKSGTTFRLFINGSQEDVDTLSSVNSSSQPFTIGRSGDAGTGFSAMIDEFRLSVGTSRWTSNFSPPAAQYT